MKKYYFILIGFLFLSFVSTAQNLEQTIRGTILDEDSNSPIIGAEVLVIGSVPMLGTVTDIDGNYKLEKVPIGRISLKLSYLGYEEKVIPNIVVNSGKETIANFRLSESILKLDEVVVHAIANKGEALNDMALISAQSISAEETERFAGGFNDPSRIVSAYAGVATANDGDNSIIVRGNSPKYIQWRLEGLEISNPNHFGDQNAVSGGISALNNNLLATSDFYTGAFAPEFGNALSGVYDLKLRSGNNEKFESTFGLGLIGTDLTFEGPFKKGYGGSFLVNYRYSTISLIDNIGLSVIDGLLRFQDAAFKVVLPSKKMGTISIFGLGGKSNFDLKNVKPDIWVTPSGGLSEELTNEDYSKGAHLFNMGLTHTIAINTVSYLKTSLSVSRTGNDDDVYKVNVFRIRDDAGQWLRDSILNRNLDFSGALKNSSYRGAVTYNNKIDVKSKIQIGVKYSLLNYAHIQSIANEDNANRSSLIDFDENVATIQNFVSWKYRLSNSLTFVAGVHNMNVLLNKQSTIEPRFAVNWKLNDRNSINLGYGNHSNIEKIHNYFALVEQADGSLTQPNTTLGLLKANHYVLAYQNRLSKNLKAKIEFYMQELYDLPVENIDTSIFATINEGLDFRYVDLVNKGKGANYGVEFTLERFFSNNYYYLLNASFFESKYKALDGIERNTAFSGNYLFNLLLGKEFTAMGKKKNKSLTLNAKIFFGGGKKVIRLLRDENGALSVDPVNNQFYDFENAYEEKLEDVYSVIISGSYKINKPKATHEIFVNLDNVTNTKGKLNEFYDPTEEGDVGYLQQFGFFPNLMYRVYF